MGSADLMKTAGYLREQRKAGSDALSLAKTAQVGMGSRFGSVAFIAVFRMAFGVPLDVLQRAQAWHGFDFGGYMISDAEFTELLRPWISAHSE
ncbi:hypothetical protein H8N00_08440 [Streptomyces sp. AC563]|uniref:hypothetical protein n=1 Tax=Streptomyces buecherae TaxID=2763006 RepID=UPI00164E7DD2|nr:hypothetical protein [Streptomyces buecherae]MBC3988909.1 hypothetical protein [Streptomyces buecherae]